MEATALALSSSPAAARRSPAKATVASLHLHRFPVPTLYLRAAQNPALRALSAPSPARRRRRRGSALVVRAEMFGQLTTGLESAWNKLRGVDVLTKDNIVEPMRDIRRALLEADVSLLVVRRFVSSVSEKALGAGIIRGVRPDQQLVKIVHDELVQLMGGEVSDVVFAKTGPTVILLAGLQGVGKTTVCAKLAFYLKKLGKSCMLVAADVYRPAAIDQLTILGEQVGVPVYSEGTEAKPAQITKNAVEEAKSKNIDAIVVDTAGRLQIDKAMMDELKEVKKAVNPTEILLVVDAMTGQEAAALVTTFNIEIGITGAILTKLDGDSRGGAALSVKEVSGKPIKFVGRGERIEDLELFYPDRMAQRVLGMGDVLSFVEKAQEVMRQEDAVELQKKIMSAKFDFNDFLKQTQNVAKMGSMSRVIGMIPGMNKVTPAQIREAEKRLAFVESMINAMTAEEREKPELLAESRDRRMRVAVESGKTEQEVSQLVAQLFQMRAQMQKLMGMMQGQEAIPEMGDLMDSLKGTWPARTKWTMQQLVHDYGEVPFRISQRSPQKITMKLKDYVSYMEQQHDEDPLYIFDDKFGESTPALLEDYSAPHLFQEDFFDILDYDQRPAFRWLIIGPERSGASWHVDPGLTSAWNTLLCGRKRWALYPPGRVPGGVTVHVSDEDGDVDIETPTSLQWWLDIYPHLAEHEKPLECTQLPGETIFVPTGWWHCVLNLEMTVAVTQNFVNQSNFEHVCLDMAPGHCHKGVCRAGLLAVPGKSIQDIENHPPGTMTRWNHPDMTRKEKRLKGSEPVRTSNSVNQCSSFEFSDVHESLENQIFSYDINFLSQFLEKERDHYSSVWSPTNSIGQREAREWLRRLWVLKPELRGLIWKGACLAINVDKWYACLEEIIACHSLPSPSEDEKLPVGTGSNPVFIVSDVVIKIYAEGGLGYSVHGLGTELQFYDLLRKVGSPLINHIPEIIASGFLVCQDGFYRTVPWDGKGIPDILAKYCPLEVSYANSCFPLGLWSKQQFGMSNSTDVSNKPIWPYMVTRKCKGDIFARVRDTLSKTDILNLASSLGVQMKNIHLLPLPQVEPVPKSEENNVNEMSKSSFNANVPPEWKQLVSTLEGRKKNIKKHLANWGGSVPQVLLEKAEEYLPPDMGFLIKFVKDDDGDLIYTFPSWIHSDIMDDNILIEGATKLGCSMDGKRTDEGELKKLNAIHIIDFSDLSIGDPLCDLIPLHLDIFHGDIDLLREFLRSYQLPFLRGESNNDIYKLVQNSKFSRASYRAMCYCILHDDNVLGAIFSLWKELRTATTWEDVEHFVWGELNRYQESPELSS